MSNNPLVSVCCITYNQESYITQTIEGFLIQKTNFPIEIIIHDDASTDNTADILREYEGKYPNMFILIYQKENQYSQGIIPITEFVFPKCQGKYIAICEGDDYWTDPYKLQKQVDFLEANEDYVLCFHNVRLLTSEGLKTDHIIRNVCETTSFNDLLYSNYIRTLSVLFRTFSLKKLVCPVQSSGIVGDYFIFMWLAQFGKIKKLNDIMGIYRIHEGSVWSAIKDTNYKNLKYADTLVAIQKTLVLSECKWKVKLVALRFISKMLLLSSVKLNKQYITNYLKLFIKCLTN